MWPLGRRARRRRNTLGIPTLRPGLPPRCSMEWWPLKWATPSKASSGIKRESNSRRAFAPMYARVFPVLIADWRAQWHEGNFPFLFVQISNIKSDATEAFATIREAQRRSLSVANAAMAVTVDIGDPDNVYPADNRQSACALHWLRGPWPGRRRGVFRPAVPAGNSRGWEYSGVVRSLVQWPASQGRRSPGV